MRAALPVKADVANHGRCAIDYEQGGCVARKPGAARRSHAHHILPTLLEASIQRRWKLKAARSAVQPSCRPQHLAIHGLQPDVDRTDTAAWLHEATPTRAQAYNARNETYLRARHVHHGSRTAARRHTAVRDARG